MYDYRKLVFDSLDQSFENGYDMTSWPAQVVVTDLMTYNDDLLVIPENECIDYVYEWQDEMLTFKREFNIT